MKRIMLLYILSAIVLITSAQTSGGEITRKPKGNNIEKSQKATGSPSGYANGHGYVNLGLPSGTIWATMNVGAKDEFSRGDRYVWGACSPGEIKDWSDYFDYKGYDEYNHVTFKTYHHGNDGKYGISPDDGHDVCRAKWGDNWRLPTKTEFEELRNNCKWKRLRIKGNDIYLITGPNGNSIYLISSEDPKKGDEWGWYYYWTSTLDTTRNEERKYDNHDEYAYQFIRSGLASYDGMYGYPNGSRKKACNIRPVFNPKDKKIKQQRGTIN